MTGPTGTAANFVGLPLLFVVILFASAVWQLDGLSRFAPGRDAGRRGHGPRRPSTGARGSWEIAGDGPDEPEQPSDRGAARRPSLAPRLEMGCHIVMCITMGYMLILML